MNVPFLDLKAQYKLIQAEIDASVHAVLEGASFILGKQVADFEHEFARAHGVNYAIGVSSGTDANHLSLVTAGICPGDEIVFPVNTFIATVWGATLCGARPVFVDCDAESYNIDPSKVEKAITKRTKAIVAVHLYGQPADMQPLQAIARESNLHLVEDAAQAHLAEYNGRRVGGLGISAAFSFYPGKNLGAYGEAGALTTNDADIARLAKIYRDQGQSSKYHHDSYGHNYRMEAIQGAVLGVKMKYLPEWTQYRRAIARKYAQLLSDVQGIVLPREMPYAKHVYHLYVIQTQNRDQLRAHLEERGIGTGLHYPIPLHLQKAFAHLGYKEGDFPISENLATRCLSLPMFPELTDDQIGYVAETIRSFY